MRNPVWILTISLTLLFIVVVGVLTLTRKQVPSRTSLAPTTITQEPKKAISSVDVRQIYEHDLFKTYKPIAEPSISPVRELRIPQPPAPLPLVTPPAAQVSFIDPLQISIKGIIRTGDDYNNRALIVDEKTKTEDIYSIGDMIEDAEILSIERNKVIFIRSNGQQETVFLNIDEAQNDPVFNAQDPWETVVQKTGFNSYSIDIEKFTQRITSLAQFIEELDITTALQDGASIGCRIGRMEPDSIGYALGFQYNDLITAINGMPVRSTKERIHVYHTLKTLSPNAQITATIKRSGAEHILNYTLEKNTSVPLTSEETQEEETAPHENVRLTIPSSLVQAQRKDKTATKQFGSRTALLQRTV